MRTIKLLLVLTTIFLSTGLFAQNYKSAVGARLGYPLGVSFKQFTGEKTAFELNAGFRSGYRYSWFNVSGAVLIHKPIKSVDGLKWYFGPGVSAYIWNYDRYYYYDDYASTTFGIQGYIGLDYAFTDIPLNLSIDWVPTFFIGRSYYSTFGAGYGSLAVRYIFKR